MKLVWPKPNRRLGAIDGLAMVGIVGFLAARFVPFDLIPGWGCRFYEMTTFPCPGCGLTRVATRFAEGDFFGSFVANPIGFFVAIFFVVAIVASALHLAFKMPIPHFEVSKTGRRVVWTFVAAAASLNYLFVIAHTRGWVRFD